jgi:hypothetical protein
METSNGPSGPLLFGLDGSREFTAQVARALGIEPAAHEEKAFDDGDGRCPARECLASAAQVAGPSGTWTGVADGLDIASACRRDPRCHVVRDPRAD